MKAVVEGRDGIVESMKFGRYGVRIRRRRVGVLGEADLQGGGSYIVEHKEPGKDWRQWGSALWDVTEAQWVRFTVWGGPRPGAGS
jgi:hypothetical protein